MEIYDSVTGVLRQSLSPADPARLIQGSPDGSMLFCTHQPPSITLWDIQTGGLIHTLAPGLKVECIAISLKGCYLAYGLSDSSIKIWDITNRKEETTVRYSSLAPHLCWLEPEEQLLIAKKVSAHIMDVVSGQDLRQFDVDDPICGVDYSQKLDKLAIVTTSEAKSTITIIKLNCRTEKPLTYNLQQPLSYFTFSQASKELVCGTKTGQLDLFNISTRVWRQLDHPTKITSLCALPDGTLAANTTDSFIQQLSSENTNTQSRQPTDSTLAMYPFDQGNTQSQQLDHLDESREWVVNGSRRICWIPPGYIRSGEATYCWAGRELVMVGQDGELRKLKFRS